MQMRTLGAVIAEARQKAKMSLKDLGKQVPKEDGKGVSAQYLHDIERDRRTPSPYVLKGLARTLDLDPDMLAAVAGQMPESAVKWLRENPGQAAAVAGLFERLREGAPAPDWASLGRNGATRREGVAPRA